MAIADWLKHPIRRQVDELGRSTFVDAAGVITIPSEKVTEYYAGPLHKTVLTFTNTKITITDEANTVQYGGALTAIYTFPAGIIRLIGAVVDGAITLGTTGTITDTWAGGIALGSVTATTGTTLTGTEATWMAEVDVAAATSKVAVVDGHGVADIVPYDGHTTAGPVFFNLVVDDSATHTSGTGTFTGTVTLTWMNLGDY